MHRDEYVSTKPIESSSTLSQREAYLVDITRKSFSRLQGMLEEKGFARPKQVDNILGNALFSMISPEMTQGWFWISQDAIKKENLTINILMVFSLLYKYSRVKKNYIPQKIQELKGFN